MYSAAMGGDAATLVSLEADLHVALERRQLKLLFQPIVALRGRHVVGAEALLRWLHPIEGLLAAGPVPADRGGNRNHRADHALDHTHGLRPRQRVAAAPAGRDRASI